MLAIVDTGCYFNSSQLTDMSHSKLFICLWFDVNSLSHAWSEAVECQLQAISKLQLDCVTDFNHQMQKHDTSLLNMNENSPRVVTKGKIPASSFDK